MSDNINTYSVPDCSMSYDEHDICPNGTHIHPSCVPNVTEGAPYYDCTPIMTYHDYETIIDVFEKYCDWDNVSSHPLPNEFIKKYHDRINWEKLLQARPFTESELNTFRSFIPIDVWGKVLPRHQALSEELMYNDRYILDWVAVSQYQKLSPNFIRKMKDYVDWITVSRYQKLPIDIIEEFSDRVSWYYVTEYQELCEQFIEKHAEDVNWTSVCEYQDMSEEFIARFAHKVDWKAVSKYRPLSEEFISNNLDRLYLNEIVYTNKYSLSEELLTTILAHPKCENHVIDTMIINQQLSPHFIEDNIIPTFDENYSAWTLISIWPRLTEEFIDTYADKLSWEHISRCQKLSEEFIDAHSDLVHWDEIFKHQTLSPEFMLKYHTRGKEN